MSFVHFSELGCHVGRPDGLSVPGLIGGIAKRAFERPRARQENDNRDKSHRRRAGDSIEASFRHCAPEMPSRIETRGSSWRSSHKRTWLAYESVTFPRRTDKKGKAATYIQVFSLGNFDLQERFDGQGAHAGQAGRLLEARLEAIHQRPRPRQDSKVSRYIRNGAASGAPQRPSTSLWRSGCCSRTGV